MSKTINLGHGNLPKVDNKLKSVYPERTSRAAGALPGAALLLPPAWGLKAATWLPQGRRNLGQKIETFSFFIGKL